METQRSTQKKLKRKKDRFSNLPDQIIIHILSFMETKYAVRTCVLSKKWRTMWTHIDSLNFDNGKFHTDCFSKFVGNVLKKRKPFKICKLRLICRGIRYPSLSERLFLYAKRHRFEELEIDLNSFPSTLWICEHLKTLKLVTSTFRSEFPALDFAPNLTTLQLTGVRISYRSRSYDLFSCCKNLENLFLTNCHIVCNILVIAAPRLANLTISGLSGLTRRNYVKISAPMLRFADFEGRYPLKLMIDGCTCALEKVNVCMFSNSLIEGYITDMICMVEALSLAKSINASWNYGKGKIILCPSTSDGRK